MNWWPLLGVGIVVVGFAKRWNPVAVVVVAALASGLAAGRSIPDLLALLGESFVSQRTLGLIFLTLPVIGVLEWAGLREQARRWIGGFRGLTLARLLVSYLGLRQGLSMVGLTNIAGHAQTVRPLLAPMAEEAAARTVGSIQAPVADEAGERADADAPAIGVVTPEQRQRVLAMAAATDNVGLFFGEDVFLAFGGVLLIQGFLAQRGHAFEPLQIALWALPTAIAAFAIHATRLWLFQRRLLAEAALAAPVPAAGHDPWGGHAPR